MVEVGRTLRDPHSPRAARGCPRGPTRGRARDRTQDRGPDRGARAPSRASPRAPPEPGAGRSSRRSQRRSAESRRASRAAGATRPSGSRSSSRPRIRGPSSPPSRPPADRRHRCRRGAARSRASPSRASRWRWWSPSRPASGRSSCARPARRPTWPRSSRCPTPDEAGVYRALGIPWCPPELREAPFRGSRRRSSKLSDLRGDLHAHTTWSDGKSSVRRWPSRTRPQVPRDLRPHAERSRRPRPRRRRDPPAGRGDRRGQRGTCSLPAPTGSRVRHPPRRDARPPGRRLAELNWVQAVPTPASGRPATS